MPSSPHASIKLDEKDFNLVFDLLPSAKGINKVSANIKILVISEL